MVLVDRGLHELPIRADIIGHKLQTDVTDHIDVQFVEAGAAVDQVVSHVKKLAGGGVNRGFSEPDLLGIESIDSDDIYRIWANSGLQEVSKRRIKEYHLYAGEPS